MPRISVKTAGEPGALPTGMSGDGEAAEYFAAAKQALQLHRIDLGAGRTMRLDAGLTDRLIYVWQGAIKVGGDRLGAGSSVIAERDARLGIAGGGERSVLLMFASATPTRHPRPGGGIHLLPAEQAPRSDSLGGSPGLGGVMHADADSPTCSLWLHENHFPGSAAPTPGDKAGVHSHSEDEIIFVIGGGMRLGQKVYGPGTAIAIAANTLYSFTAGPEGLRFVNFRAGMPGDIRFADGRLISETQYWRERLPRPEYLEGGA